MRTQPPEDLIAMLLGPPTLVGATSARRQAATPVAALRFAFYGRTSTVNSRIR